jgi:hypothetical protein
VVRLEIDPASRFTAIGIARTLESGTPAVYLATGDASSGRLAIDPFCMQPGEARLVIARVQAAFGR